MFLRLHQIELAPPAMGLYAWYCRYSISKADITQLISDLSTTQDESDKISLVTNFLERRIFNRFREAPYNVRISAALKPQYSGQARHVPAISDSLVERLVSEPQRLFSLADALSKSVPNFSSPIYIGTAINLKKRLSHHAKLLVTLDPNAPTLASEDLEDRLDHSFAVDALSRRISTNDLWVHVQPFDFAPELRFDLENLLNRINFPLCGRN